MNFFNKEFVEMNKKAAKATLDAKNKLENGLIDQAKNHFLIAGKYDLAIARFLEKQRSSDLAAEYFISSGSAFLNSGENDRALAIFKNIKQMKEISNDLATNIEILLDEAETKKNYNKLSIRDKKNIEALMAAIYEKFGFIGGRGTVMKVYHLVSSIMARYGLPALLIRGRVSYSPVFYKQINDFLKWREELKLLERDSNNHLIPSSNFLDYIIAEKNILMLRLDRIDFNLKQEVEEIIEHFGNFIMKEWEEFEEISLGISRKRNYRELI